MDRLTSEDYRVILSALVPPGQALPIDSQSNWQQLLGALATEFARADARAAALVTEMIPQTTFELLADWEETAGLPDPCIEGEQTIEERRLGLLRLITGTGGQSRAYFIDLAAALGYDIDIHEWHPHTVEDDVTYPINGSAWRYAWEVRAPEETVLYATVQSTVDEPLATWGNDRLECVIERYKPAHTYILFAYGETE